MHNNFSRRTSDFTAKIFEANEALADATSTLGKLYVRFGAYVRVVGLNKARETGLSLSLSLTGRRAVAIRVQKLTQLLVRLNWYFRILFDVLWCALG
jgi:hypothetical protein